MREKDSEFKEKRELRVSLRKEDDFVVKSRKKDWAHSEFANRWWIHGEFARNIVNSKWICEKDSEFIIISLKRQLIHSGIAK